MNDHDFETHVWGLLGPKVREVLRNEGRPEVEAAVKRRLRDFPAYWTAEVLVEHLVKTAACAEIDLHDARPHAGVRA